MRKFLPALIFCICLTSAGARCEEELRVLFGNLHSHTSYSDGSGTPAQAYKVARKNGLDFLAITEHNHAAAESGAGDRQDGKLIATNPSLYNGTTSKALIPSALAATENGKFIALYGQEYSTISSGNHCNVFEIRNVISASNGKFDELTQWMSQNNDSTGKLPLLQFNHPSQALRQAHTEYGLDDFGTEANWIREMGKYACLIEILNGPGTKNVKGVKPETFESDYLHYLSRGFHVAPTGNQDNHYLTQGILTNARTGVLVKAVTREGLLEALRARHVFATEDKDLAVVFRLNVNGAKHLSGDRVAAPPAGTPVSIEFSINDKTDPDAHYTINVISGTIQTEQARVIEQVVQEGNTTQPQTISDLTYTGGSQYFFLKVVQHDEDGNSSRAWTAPVWLEPAAEPPAPAPADTAAFASRRSAIYHLSMECRDAKRISPENLIRGLDAMKGRQPHENCPVK